MVAAATAFTGAWYTYLIAIGAIAGAVFAIYRVANIGVKGLHAHLSGQDHHLDKQDAARQQDHDRLLALESKVNDLIERDARHNP